MKNLAGLLSTWFLILTLTLTSWNVLACTICSFPQNPADQTVAYNLDWYDVPLWLMTNPRGVKKTGFNQDLDGNESLNTPVTWTAKYGSYTVTPVGRDFAITGMNERGLVVSMLETDEIPGTRENGLPTLNELQLPQYLLDTCGDLDEVHEALKKIRLKPSFVGLHYFVAETHSNENTSPRTAVLEISNGELQIRENLPVTALENYTYGDSLERAKKNNPDLQKEKITAKSTRFEKLSAAVKAFKGGDPVEHALESLDTVNQGTTRLHAVYGDGAMHLWLRQTPNDKPLVLELKNLSLGNSQTLGVELGSVISGAAEKSLKPLSPGKNLSLPDMGESLCGKLLETLDHYMSKPYAR